MNNEHRFRQTKLAGRLQDPAEKALVLMRDPAGHEGGTVRDLRAILELNEADRKAVKRADWWSSAADRPQWLDARWTRVYWTSDPVLLHPLSGANIESWGSVANANVNYLRLLPAPNLEADSALRLSLDVEPGLADQSTNADCGTN